MSKVNRTVLHDSVVTVQEFSTGGTVRVGTDYFKNDSGLWQWDGEFPKTVSANSTPQSSGGVGTGAWIGVDGVALREDIKNGDGSLIGTVYGKTLDEVIFGRIYEGGDAAEKVREVLAQGYSPMFMNGVHKFKTTVKNGDGEDCFALVPSNTTIHTESKNVFLRPEVAADCFFSPQDVASTDIYVKACTVFGVAEGTTSPRIVPNFFPARIADGDNGRVVRFNMQEVNMVDFDKGFDAYTWSNNLTNTDAGWCTIGYNFRKGMGAPTSYRLIGTGATSCTTSYVIEDTTYSVMLNSFCDDADLGIHVKQAKGLAIIQPGFEHCKQLAIIGTDHWSSTTQGINWSGAFCYRRWRSNKSDNIENYADWGVEVYRTFESSFDFSGMDYSWIKRNKINFIKFKDCFRIHLDGLAPETVYVDTSGASTYKDISLGSKCVNQTSSFYISGTGSDTSSGASTDKPMKTFDKVDFILMDKIKSVRSVTVLGDVPSTLVLTDKRIDIQNGLSILGGGYSVQSMQLKNLSTCDSGLTLNNFKLLGNSRIESCSGFNINTLTLREGVKLELISSTGYIGNLVMEGNAELICAKGTQLKLGSVTGGKITSNSSIVYRDRPLNGVQLAQSAGGQIF